ncbi:hypothetical protein ACVR05_01790 [Streptococcus caprae]|uniref:Uncharacterized protein n=1 Tax=Streptococcus caprae TaxID=1640501 RepID=A0ABV8CXA7_9STRE
MKKFGKRITFALIALVFVLGFMPLRFDCDQSQQADNVVYDQKNQVIYRFKSKEERSAVEQAFEKDFGSQLDKNAQIQSSEIQTLREGPLVEAKAEAEEMEVSYSETSGKSYRLGDFIIDSPVESGFETITTYPVPAGQTGRIFLEGKVREEKAQAALEDGKVISYTKSSLLKDGVYLTVDYED